MSNMYRTDATDLRPFESCMQFAHMAITEMEASQPHVDTSALLDVALSNLDEARRIAADMGRDVSGFDAARALVERVMGPVEVGLEKYRASAGNTPLEFDAWKQVHVAFEALMRVMPACTIAVHRNNGPVPQLIATTSWIAPVAVGALAAAVFLLGFAR